MNSKFIPNLSVYLLLLLVSRKPAFAQDTSVTKNSTINENERRPEKAESLLEVSAKEAVYSFAFQFNGRLSEVDLSARVSLWVPRILGIK